MTGGIPRKQEIVDNLTTLKKKEKKKKEKRT